MLLDITKPLRRIIKIRNSKKNIVIMEVKYERLMCDLFVHIEHDCCIVSKDDRVVEK